MTTAAATPELTAVPLWDRARAKFARALKALGSLAVLAALTRLPRAARRTVLGLLCPIEHIVRKLLIAEAAVLRARLDTAAMLKARRLRSLNRAPQNAAATPRPRRAIDVNEPSSWPARFSFSVPSDPRRVPESRAPRIRNPWIDTPPPPPPPPPRVLAPEQSPFRLARRFEAVRRVLENPMPHAERLARLLFYTIRRFPAVVQRYVFAPTRIWRYDEYDPRLSIEAMGAAMLAEEAVADTS